MASESTTVGSSYTPFSQLDDAWKRVMLGESSTTIGANGCLLCSVASGLADLGVTIQGLPADPPRLNRWLARNRGFVAPRNQTKERSLFVFDSMQPLGVKMVEYVDARRRSAPLNVIEDALGADDLFVAIHVDFSPGGSAQQHWVRAVAWYDHDIKVMDPWITGSTQEAYLMTRYALPSWDDPSRAIYRIVVYQVVDPKTTYPTSGVPTRSIVQERLYTYQP